VLKSIGPGNRHQTDANAGAPVSPIDPSVRDLARSIVRRAINRGEPTTALYPIAVAARRVYASADPDKTVGPDTVTERGTTFHLGLRR
jgi:hypothetical protein